MGSPSSFDTSPSDAWSLASDVLETTSTLLCSPASSSASSTPSYHTAASHASSSSTLRNLLSTNSNKFTVAHLNIRSLVAHLSDIIGLLASHCFDVLALSETWLSDAIPSSALTISNYSLFRSDRKSSLKQRGGGVAVYVKSDIRCMMLDNTNIFCDVSDSDPLLDFVGLHLIINYERIALFSIYRPPTCSLSFIDSLLEYLLQVYLSLIFCFCFSSLVLDLV